MGGGEEGVVELLILFLLLLIKIYQAMESWNISAWNVTRGWLYSIPSPAPPPFWTNAFGFWKSATHTDKLLMRKNLGNKRTSSSSMYVFKYQHFLETVRVVSGEEARQKPRKLLRTFMRNLGTLFPSPNIKSRTQFIWRRIYILYLQYESIFFCIKTAPLNPLPKKEKEQFEG